MAIYALLDLDETLIDSDTKVLNEAALQVLAEFGIKNLLFHQYGQQSIGD